MFANVLNVVGAYSAFKQPVSHHNIQSPLYAIIGV